MEHMDSIRITGITAAGTHGVLDFEHERAQTFVVDATLFLDLAPAGRSDALSDTVDYGRIAKTIVAIIEGEHVDLIERLAGRIADSILEYPSVTRTEVTVHKPGAPITVPFADVSVTIDRSRETSGPATSDATSRPHHAVVALGGNLGDVQATLRDAVRCIDALPGTQVTGVSPLYRTAAWGMTDGAPDFLNAVAALDTTLEPEALLDALHTIESEHGRTREEHWGSRTLDLDIVDVDGMRRDDPALTLPHPRAWQRAFVLVPWSQLDPEADLPGLHGGPVNELADGLLAEAAEDGEAAPVELVAHDWLSAGMQQEMPESHTDNSAVSAAAAPAFAATHTPAAPTPAPAPVSRRAIISMDSTDQSAERLFREAIATLDSIPGNQVEGISPLYHIANFDGPDAMAAVAQISTRLSARDLIGALGEIEAAHDKAADLDLIDMEGVTCDELDCRVPWPSAREHAAVLAPWLDMDPEAKLGRDPVSYLLALAPDAARVGLLSADWILAGMGGADDSSARKED